jgi:hypothetical protein
MNLLVSFYYDFGRTGHLEGLFVCTKAEYNKLIGQYVYFGEALGKHSEIYCTIHDLNLKVVSEDQEKVNWLVEVMKNKTISGYNPLDYLEEDEEVQSNPE